LGCSPFARHYSGNRGFFPFLGLLRCFSSPAYLHCTYGFSAGYPRITTGGFPHSEIPGSMPVQRLPEAYRSRPRPSSAPDAKASTVCPCSLESRLLSREHQSNLRSLCSFQGTAGRRGPLKNAWRPARRPRPLCRVVPGPSKLNSMGPRSLARSQGTSRGVDMCFQATFRARARRTSPAYGIRGYRVRRKGRRWLEPPHP
jgi:hypothetical protein